ncbi:hypothetical protein L1D14_04240 [Vibrio tubiashii]|uniref:hypothetical protein n=1 Tax=Vibrio tubiashii TaxID=29498 RepID=UPI001EFCF373|nr:hypothetical protein [Vibrio tubiashii]MCG9575441.1 hypothetical protein [Vibrio tubiashii]
MAGVSRNTKVAAILMFTLAAGGLFYVSTGDEREEVVSEIERERRAINDELIAEHILPSEPNLAEIELERRQRGNQNLNAFLDFQLESVGVLKKQFLAPTSPTEPPLIKELQAFEALTKTQYSEGSQQLIAQSNGLEHYTEREKEAIHTIVSEQKTMPVVISCVPADEIVDEEYLPFVVVDVTKGSPRMVNLCPCSGSIAVHKYDKLIASLVSSGIAVEALSATSSRYSKWKEKFRVISISRRASIISYKVLRNPVVKTLTRSVSFAAIGYKTYQYVDVEFFATKDELRALRAKRDAEKLESLLMDHPQAYWTSEQVFINHQLTQDKTKSCEVSQTFTAILYPRHPEDFVAQKS